MAKVRTEIKGSSQWFQKDEKRVEVECKGNVRTYSPDGCPANTPSSDTRDARLVISRDSRLTNIKCPSLSYPGSVPVCRIADELPREGGSRKFFPNPCIATETQIVNGKVVLPSGMSEPKDKKKRRGWR